MTIKLHSDAHQNKIIELPPSGPSTPTPKAKRIALLDNDERAVIQWKFGLNHKKNSNGDQIVAETCCEGSKIEQFCQDFNPDLALLDVLWETQPGITYTDITRILNARGIPIVLVSTEIRWFDAYQSKERIIVRPVYPEEVYQLLLDWRFI